MSENEVESLRREMVRMSRAIDTLAERCERGLESIKEAITPLREQGIVHELKLTDLTGRVTFTESVLETMKQFRWQTLTAVSILLLAAKLIWGK